MEYELQRSKAQTSLWKAHATLRSASLILEECSDVDFQGLMADLLKLKAEEVERMIETI